MPVEKNGRWFSVALFLVAFMLGGGVSAFVGNYQYQKLEAKVDRLSEKVDAKFDKVGEDFSALGASVARIEGSLGIIKK